MHKEGLSNLCQHKRLREYKSNRLQDYTMKQFAAESLLYVLAAWLLTIFNISIWFSILKSPTCVVVRADWNLTRPTQTKPGCCSGFCGSIWFTNLEKMNGLVVSLLVIYIIRIQYLANWILTTHSSKQTCFREWRLYTSSCCFRFCIMT